MYKILTVINQFYPFVSSAENLAQTIVENTNNDTYLNDVLTVASERVKSIAGKELSYKERVENLYTIYRFELFHLFGKEKNGRLYLFLSRQEITCMIGQQTQQHVNLGVRQYSMTS